jgi:hypothetical protein
MTMRMKAAQISKPGGDWELVERDIPEPGTEVDGTTSEGKRGGNVTSKCNGRNRYLGLRRGVNEMPYLWFL